MKTSTKVLFAITGVLLVALGIVCICNPGATVISLALTIGIMTLASGISTIINWARLKYFLPTGNLLLSGILQVIIGLLFINYNLVVAAALPFVFSCWICAEGIILAIRSFDFKKFYFKSWWVLLILGIITAAIGICCLINPIEIGGSVMTYFIGAAIIMMGVIDLVALIEFNKIEKYANNMIQGE